MTHIPSSNVFPDGPEHPLLGGDVTEGLVRIGDTVRRPRSVVSDSVRELLIYLERAGFEGAPRHLGIDSQGRDVLTFVTGEVATRPWPAWMADADLAISVARLVRRYDDAAVGFGFDSWDDGFHRPSPDGMPDSISPSPQLVGHMDITPENVVFRGGSAAALIDFDLARPVSRADELCNLLLWWAPLMPPEDREDAVRYVDAVDRTRLLTDAYGASDSDRRILISLALNQAERSWYSMRWRAEHIGGGWKRMWDDGVGDRILRRQDWLRANRDVLEAAASG